MHRFAAPYACVLFVAGLAATVNAQAPTGDLFLAVESGVFAEASDLAIQPDGATVLRQRLAQVDRALLARARVDAGRPEPSGGAPAPLRLNLFEDVVLRVDVDRTGPTSAGYWLSGRIEGPVPGSMTLVVSGDIVAGTVHVHEGVYAIRDAGDRQVAIQQIDPLTITRCAGVLGPSAVRSAPDRVRPITPPSSPRVSARVPRGREDGSRIDVLVVAFALPCPQDAEGRCLPEEEDERERRTAGKEAEIESVVAATNQAFADSGVGTRLHLTAVRFLKATPALGTAARDGSTRRSSDMQWTHTTATWTRSTRGETKRRRTS